MVNRSDPVTAWLLDRAESYWQDSKVLTDDGDIPMGAAYRAIAEELRKCAAEVAAATA